MIDLEKLFTDWEVIAILRDGSYCWNYTLLRA